MSISWKAALLYLNVEVWLNVQHAETVRSIVQVALDSPATVDEYLDRQH